MAEGPRMTLQNRNRRTRRWALIGLTLRICAHLRSLRFLSGCRHLRLQLAVTVGMAALMACDGGTTTEPVPTSPVAESVIGQACDNACNDTNAICLTDFPDGYCTAQCGSDLACPGDSLCVASTWGNICVERCSEPDDCRTGYTCREHTLGGAAVGVCDVASPSGHGDAGQDVSTSDVLMVPSLGEPCLSSAECEVEEPLVATCVSGFAGGYCSARCEPDGDDCGAGAMCIRSSVGGICVLRCDGAPELCRTGYGCCTVGEASGCLPPDTIDGCEPIGPVGDGELGDPCEGDRDCGAGVNPGCSLDIEGGYCTSWGCSDDADCGDAGVCLDAFTSLCLRACDAEGDDCRDDQVCCAVREDGATACVAPSFCTVP